MTAMVAGIEHHLASLSPEKRSLDSKDKVKWAFVYGSVPQGKEDSASDVDIMLIGDVTTMEIVPVFRRIEKMVCRPINETIFLEKDFRDAFRIRNRFLRTVMGNNKIMLKGSGDGLDAVACDGKMRKHQTSKQKLDELRSVVKRDLEDAAIPALSEDRKFATAYNAALPVTKMAVAWAG